MYKCLSCLCSCKDRAFSATSATLEEKKAVCGLSEDGSMTMFDSGGNGLFLELACGVDSVIQNASREFGANYIGIHAGLELLSTQRRA